MQDGQTALHCATLKGHSNILNALLAEGCDPEAKNKVRRQLHSLCATAIGPLRTS